MSNVFRNPLEGYPHTVETTGADGVPSFSITPCALTPGRAKAAHGLASLLSFGLFVALAYYLWTVAGFGLPQIAVALVVFAGVSHLLPRACESGFRHPTEIKMTAEAISVRSARGWVHYSRLLEHRFALYPHDWTSWEQRNHDYQTRQAAADGHVVSPAVYYGESLHLVLVYAGHRIDLTTVYGPSEAAAIVARLQYCDRCLDKALEMGGGVPKRPEDEWNDAPGGMAS